MDKEQADYFDGFDNELAFSSEWVERWLKFVELHHRDREGEYPPSRLCEIETVLINDIRSAEGVLAIIKLFELHWMVRDHQRREFKRAKAKPLPGALYILWDFKDRPVEHPIERQFFVFNIV